MAEYASRGVGAAGLTTGIIGASGVGLSVLSALLNGGNCNNGMCAHGDTAPVNRYEMGLEKDLAAKDSKIALLESTIYTDGKLNDLRNYVERKLDHVEHELRDQKVFNATAISNIGCIQGQIAQLYGLTKLVVPNSSICPGWGDVTVSVTPATAAAG